MANDVTETERFYAKLAHGSYRAEANKGTHMLSDISHYSDTNYSNTPASLAGYGLEDRRVLYTKRDTGYDHLDIWLPNNRDNDPNVPIYVVFRGTSNVYDGFQDINLLSNHLGFTSADYAAFNTTKTQFMLAVNELMALQRSEKIVFVSHSLGSEFALHIWHALWTYPGSIYQDRLLVNYMFNPFILVDDVFTASLAMNENYKAGIQASIIDSDIFTTIYKKHPIGPIKLYGDVAVEGSALYYTYQQFLDEQLSWLQYLDIRNHRIISFLNDDATQYPTQAYVHYTPDGSTKNIQTRRTYSINISDANGPELLQGQHMQMKLHKSGTDNSVHTWQLSNININSHGNEIAEMELSILYSDEPQYMVYFEGKWSLPLIINQDNNPERFYIFDSLNPLQIDPLYYFAKVSGDQLYFLKPYQNIAGNDITHYLQRQESQNTAAYKLETMTELNAAILRGYDSMIHKNFEWLIVPPQLPTHAGYLGGSLRRSSQITYHIDRLSILHQPELTTANCSIATMPQLNDQGYNSTFYLISFNADWLNWSDPNLQNTYYDTTIYTTGQNETFGVTGIHQTFNNAEPPFPHNVNTDENTWTLQRNGNEIDSYSCINTETNAPMQGNALIAPTGSYLMIEPDITQDTTGTTGLAFVHMYMLQPDGSKHYFFTRNRNPYWCNFVALPMDNQYAPAQKETFVIQNINASNTIVAGQP